MPVALPESVRETCRLLFIQGVRHDDIAKETGVRLSTIQTWGSRHGWSKVKSQAKALLEGIVAKPVLIQTQIATDLATTSNNVRTKLARHLEHVAEGLDSAKPVKSLLGVSTQAKAVNDLVQNASKVFGWGDENREVLVNVTMMSQPIPCGVLEQGVNDKVIDVDTTSVQPQ